MSTMPITNWQAWGKLVITWARDPAARPKNVQELNQQMAKANVGGSFSETQFSRVAFGQAPDPQTIQLFLPTAAAVDAAIKNLTSGGSWVLPDFYSLHAFDGAPVHVKDADKIRFLEERIGDYAIGQCG